MTLRQPATISFYCGLAALFTHELDAVLRAEWNLLYMLRDLDTATATQLFIGLHFPLFIIFLWLSHHSRSTVQLTFRSVTAAFLLVHAGLHLRLSDAAEYQFEGPASNAWIYGGATFGALYLVLALLERAATRSKRE